MLSYRHFYIYFNIKYSIYYKLDKLFTIKGIVIIALTLFKIKANISINIKVKRQ